MKAQSETTREPGAQSALEGAAGSFVELYRSVRKHMILVVASVLLVTGIGLVYTKAATPVYQAMAMVEIMPHAPQPLGDKGDAVFEMGAGVFYDNRDYYETQYKILSSDRVLRGAARDLALAND